MEEKERYIYHEVSNEVEHYECYWDNKEGCELFDDEAVLNRLNEQDFELKKLNQENIKLIEENQQLKQSQNQVAISELEKIYNLFEPYENSQKDTILCANNGISFVDYLENQIKSLKGEE